MVRWFSQQKAPVRKALLDAAESGVIDPGVELAYARILEETARQLRKRAAAPVFEAVADEVMPGDPRSAEELAQVPRSPSKSKKPA